MIRPVAKFNGKYRVLKPKGFEFLSMYASNYRTYRKPFGICDDSIWIFVKGNDVEIMDFYQKTGWLINCFIKNRDKIPEMVDNDCFTIRMNTKTGKVWHYNINEMRYNWRLEKKLYSRIDKYGDTALHIYLKKWKTAHIPIELVDEVLKLYDEGLIKLEDTDFPEK